MSSPLRLSALACGIAAAIVLPLLITAAATAQDPAPAPAAEPAPAAAPSQATAPSQDDESLGSIFTDSVRDSPWIAGGFYVMLGALSLAGVTVALERSVRITRSRVIPRAFVSQLREQIDRNTANADSLQSICKAHPSPIANVLESALQRKGRPLPEVEKAMEDGVAKEYARLRGSVRPLSVIGNISPLVGLYGTVVGMIIAFRIASKAGMGKAELLAEGIYLALLTTALGLTIAIPSLLVLAWLNARIDRYTHEMDDHLMAALPSFGRMEQR